MTDLEYYEDSSKHGEYQYTLLTDLITDFMMSRDSDDYTSNIPRYKVLYQAKRAMRELYFDVANNIKAIELDLSPTLNVILPPDFVKYVRISWLDSNGQLHPMAMDNGISTADEYLQDNEYEILFDNEGYVLEGDKSKSLSELDRSELGTYNIAQVEYQPNKDASNSYPNSKFKLDTSEGLIKFNSTAEYKSIVLEYISDGLYERPNVEADTTLKIHKFAEQAVLDYIYYHLIKNKRSTPANEKMRARKEYYNSKRQAKRRITPLTKENLLQIFKSDSKFIK
jgi:hypothetical protein